MLYNRPLAALVFSPRVGLYYADNEEYNKTWDLIDKDIPLKMAQQFKEEYKTFRDSDLTLETLKFRWLLFKTTYL